MAFWILEERKEDRKEKPRRGIWIRGDNDSTKACMSIRMSNWEDQEALLEPVIGNIILVLEAYKSFVD